MPCDWKNEAAPSRPALFWSGIAFAFFVPSWVIKAGVFAGLFYCLKKKTPPCNSIESVLKHGVDALSNEAKWKDDEDTSSCSATLEMPGVKNPEIIVDDDKRIIKVRGARNDLLKKVESAIVVPVHVNISSIRAHMADGLIVFTGQKNAEGRILPLDSEPDYQKI